jgi:hypothetical protein
VWFLPGLPISGRENDLQGVRRRQGDCVGGQCSIGRKSMSSSVCSFLECLSKATHFSLTPPPTPALLPCTVRVASSKLHELAAQTAEVTASIGKTTALENLMMRCIKRVSLDSRYNNPLAVV